MRKHKSGGRFPRYAAIVAVFAAVYLIYTIRLLTYQLSGSETVLSRSYDMKTYTYTVTIPALRGDICDRNGLIIATTKETYSMTFEYWSMPADKLEANRTILVGLEALDKLEESGVTVERAEDYFPFRGSYPNYTLSSDAKDGDSTLGKKLARVIKRREWDEDMTGDEIIQWYLKKFSMLDSEGKPRYSDEEMDRLLRVRYNMDAEDFGAYADYVLATDLPLETVVYVREKNAVGIKFPKSTGRAYNYPGYLSHILGSVGSITAETLDYYTELGYSINTLVGVDGIEKLYETELHGTNGLMEVVEDEDGHIVSTKVVREPIPGKDVWLTIDMVLQVAAEDALAVAAEKYCAGEVKAGAVTAIDPEDGGVLVLASYPTYDLTQYNAIYNELAADVSNPLLNRTLYGLYTPGSTFKLGTAAAALEAGVVDQYSTVYCSGVYHGNNTNDAYEDWYYSRGLQCWVYPDSHGWLSVKGALTVSCNCYFCEMGYRLGIDTMNKYSKMFGLGEATGIELGEAVGILAGEDYRMSHGMGNWYVGDTIAAAIGQSDNQFTPIQISNYVSTLLSGGTRYRVHLLDSVREYYTDEVISSYTPVVESDSHISSSTVSILMESMRSMIDESYTASTAMKNIPVAVGGKTGTAQTNAANDNGLFVCAAPYNNPEIVMSCVLEGAKSGLNSTSIAAAVLEAYYGVGEE